MEPSPPISQLCRAALRLKTTIKASRVKKLLDRKSYEVLREAVFLLQGRTNEAPLLSQQTKWAFIGILEMEVLAWSIRKQKEIRTRRQSLVAQEIESVKAAVDRLCWTLDIIPTGNYEISYGPNFNPQQDGDFGIHHTIEADFPGSNSDDDESMQECNNDDD
ncbi:uncharacterized protein KY384_000515 [Bacidia gigantensis]|uniref:uncharacterized protein n=1 Tax=Bacidia gigantensis TaxID=2732470 RepID=UPI001D050530|nr:uncharacterized protein KY384_000515 [Bacidia gigantensis]KAG8525755.1 hypothetical protein KY384_000515 [Bacidia gigantensis]